MLRFGAVDPGDRVAAQADAQPARVQAAQGFWADPAGWYRDRVEAGAVDVRTFNTSIAVGGPDVFNSDTAPGNAGYDTDLPQAPSVLSISFFARYRVPIIITGLLAAAGGIYFAVR